MAKITIYIEADDEITTVIDKVVSVDDSIVAVVLPKRASVFQSVVNLKLLKKASEEADKKVVLISSEPAIEMIAAVAGMHIANSLTSQPFIPKKAKITSSEATISSKEFESEANHSDETKIADETDSADAAEDSSKDSIESDTIELDNTEEVAQELPEGSIVASEALAQNAKKKRGFRIPDFSSFRLRLGLGITAVILLIVGWFFGFVILPKATISINTDTSSQTVTMAFVAKTDAAEIDEVAGILPAKKAEVSKENKLTITTTGEKNTGEKASGEVTLSAKICGSIATPDDVPAGTGVSTNGKTYITQTGVSFSFKSIVSGCINFDGETTPIVAQDSGTSSNLSPNSAFTVSQRPEVSGSGTASGGTDTIVKIVSAEDVNKAKEQLKGSATADAITELSAKLSDQQLQALLETLHQSEPSVKNSPAVGAEAAEVTVTQTVTYSMLGISSADLGQLLDARIKESLKDTPDKNVRSNGLGTAVYALATKTSADNQTINIQTVAILGPEFDEAAIRKEVIGKKRGEIERMLESRDGVKSVSVEYSPFWITTTPKKESKITITINELKN